MQAFRGLGENGRRTGGAGGGGFARGSSTLQRPSSTRLRESGSEGGMEEPCSCRSWKGSVEKELSVPHLCCVIYAWDV